MPTVLLFALCAGLLAERLRPLALAVLSLGVTWGVLIAAGAGDDVGDFAAATLLGAANALVGVLVGAMLRLVVFGAARLLSQAR